MPEYKSLEKLINNVILDLENKTFREAERLDEFLGVKWAIAMLKLITSSVDAENRKVVNKQVKAEKDISWMEELPDNITL